MHLRYLSWLLLCATIATVSLRAQTPAPIVGGAELILVAKATAGVTMTLPGQPAAALKKDDKVPQQAKVNTGNGASAVLVFSNGATLRLEANSELVIEEYLQDPFSSAIKVSDMK